MPLRPAPLPSLPLNRRACLQSLALAAAALGRPAVAAPDPAPLRLKKAVKYYMLQENLSVLDKFKLLADLGYAGTELHITHSIDRQEVLRAIEKTGVVVHGIINSAEPDLKKSIDAAKFYGADSVMLVCGRVDQDHPYERVYVEQQAWIRQALPHAERQGVKLLVENVWNDFLLSPLEMRQFLDELHSPFAAMYFDLGNVVRYGWPEQWLRILGPRVIKLDVKDYSRKKQRDEGLWKGFDIELGEGDCDWPAIRAALRDIGFTSGWAAADGRGGNRHKLAGISKRMDELLECGMPSP